MTKKTSVRSEEFNKTKFHSTHTDKGKQLSRTYNHVFSGVMDRRCWILTTSTAHNSLLFSHRRIITGDKKRCVQIP